MSEKTDDLFTVMTIINCLMRFMSHMNTIWIVLCYSLICTTFNVWL